MDKLLHMHGGDLDAIEETYHIPKNQIADFSGNINPLGFPESVKKALIDNIDIVTTYPDKSYKALRESVANYTNTDSKYVTVGNGSTELISTFIKSVNAKKTIIMGPAYSEYEHAVSLISGTCAYFRLCEEDNFELNINALLDILCDDVGLFIACNPNNPTGTCIQISQMEIILKHCHKKNISVMIDETYIEFSDNIMDICSIPLVKKYDNLFVIRGISKFFAAPGLRLGYGITSSMSFHNLIERNQDPWSVNSLASFAGERLFRDYIFIEKTKKFISNERSEILSELKQWKNVKAYSSGANFILIKLLTDKISSAEIFHLLIQKSLLIRDASSFEFLDESFLRFCILSHDNNRTLLTELKRLIETY